MNNKNLDIALWLTMINGMLAKERDVAPSQAFAYLQETGALDYLVDCYDIEHLENPYWVVRHIYEYAQSHPATV